MKDLFVDNNIAKNFCNPLDEEYKKLISWIATEGHLVASQKLLIEYQRSSMGAKSNTNIMAIIAELQKKGRFCKFDKKEIENFKAEYFTKKVEKKLTCNHEDRELIPVVFLSN